MYSFHNLKGGNVFKCYLVQYSDTLKIHAMTWFLAHSSPWGFK